MFVHTLAYRFYFGFDDTKVDYVTVVSDARSFHSYTYAIIVSMKSLSKSFVRYEMCCSEFERLLTHKHIELVRFASSRRIFRHFFRFSLSISHSTSPKNLSSLLLFSHVYIPHYLFFSLFTDPSLLLLLLCVMMCRDYNAGSFSFTAVTFSPTVI